MPDQHLLHQFYPFSCQHIGKSYQSTVKNLLNKQQPSEIRVDGNQNTLFFCGPFQQRTIARIRAERAGFYRVVPVGTEPFG